VEITRGFPFTGNDPEAADTTLPNTSDAEPSADAWMNFRRFTMFIA
jgi:hypothetical protein